MNSDVITTAKPVVFWTDRPDAPVPGPHLRGTANCDLAIVGGGYSGLWAALQALEDQPGRRVVVLESERCGFGASTRNGGFCAASLTHGEANGAAIWPDEADTLTRLGAENLAGIEAALQHHQISASFERVGSLSVATEQWQLAAPEPGTESLDQEAVRARLNSPTYLGGSMALGGLALVDPAQLLWGLRGAVEKLGGVIHEGSAAVSVEPVGAKLEVITADGSLTAGRAIMATNAYPGPIQRPQRYIIPVYDHVLMTAPLSSEQMGEVGWKGREGVADMANQFHYYRLTADNRILWGGYDATYHFNNGLQPKFDLQNKTHQKLAQHFRQTFPQLEGLEFTHRWGGPIAATTRFTCAWGTAHSGRLAWVGGYTGLGVGASRFGARVALDLVDGLDTPCTRLQMVRKRPLPFPPEPLRSAAVALTKKAIRNADSNAGRRGRWLALLDRLGVGFDS